MDVLQDVLVAHPLKAAIVAFVTFCVVTQWVRSKLGETKAGGTSSSEGIAEARARQQAAHDEARQQRRSPAASSSAPRPGSSSGPASPAPAQPLAPPRNASDPKSYSQRMEKIQKGKGDSGSNPLKGHNSGTGGSSVVNRKRGG